MRLREVLGLSDCTIAGLMTHYRQYSGGTANFFPQAQVPAAMLVEVQKGNKAFKDLQQLLIQQIRQEYQKTSGGSVR